MRQEDLKPGDLIDKASELISTALSLGSARGYRSQTPEDLVRAVDLLTSALAIIRVARERTLEASCLRELAQVYAVQLRFPESIECFEQAIEILQSTGSDPKTLGHALWGLGSLVYEQCDYPSSLQAFLSAVAIFEDLGDRSAVCGLYIDIGNTYRDAGMYEKSLDTCLHAADFARETGDREGEILSVGNAAQALMMLGRVDEAVSTGERALDLATPIGGHSLYSALVCLGRALVSAGRSSVAVPMFRQADAIWETMPNHVQTTCSTKLMLGEALVEANELTEALPVLRKTVELAALIDMKRDAARAHLSLSRLFKREGDYVLALEHFEEYHNLNARIFSEESDKRIKTILSQWETEKARQEAEIHRLRNVELTEANRALETANVLLQDQAEELQAQAEELEAQAEELERLATVDGLTDLYNRRYMHEWFSRKFVLAQGRAESLAVAMADVDHFKLINDRFGHQVGDFVLQTVARLIGSVCRRSDLAARYGGEEFVIVLPETDLDGALSLCERIRVSVEQYAWDEIRPGLSVTLSVGIAGDTSVVDYEAMLSVADEQLYLAKHAGRNRVSPETKTDNDALAA